MCCLAVWYLFQTRMPSNARADASRAARTHVFVLRDKELEKEWVHFHALRANYRILGVPAGVSEGKTRYRNRHGALQSEWPLYCRDRRQKSAAKTSSAGCLLMYCVASAVPSIHHCMRQVDEGMREADL